MLPLPFRRKVFEKSSHYLRPPAGFSLASPFIPPAFLLSEFHGHVSLIAFPVFLTDLPVELYFQPCLEVTLFFPSVRYFISLNVFVARPYPSKVKHADIRKLYSSRASEIFPFLGRNFLPVFLLSTCPYYRTIQKRNLPVST